MKEMVLKHTQGYIQDSGLGGRGGGGGGQCNTGMYRCAESGGGGGDNAIWECIGVQRVGGTMQYGSV